MNSNRDKQLSLPRNSISYSLKRPLEQHFEQPFFAPLTSLFAHASLRILDCKIKYANGQTDMLIYSPPTPAIIPTL